MRLTEKIAAIWMFIVWHVTLENALIALYSHIIFTVSPLQCQIKGQ
jgi:hypothetical protein